MRETEFKERMLAIVEQPLRQCVRGEAAPKAGRSSGRTARRKPSGCWRAGWRRWDWQNATGGDEEGRLGKGGAGVVVVPAHDGAAALGVRAVGDGDESRVTQAIGRLKRKGQPELERLKRRLEQVYENHNGEVEV